jgi:ATP-binding cassette subfamily B protein
VLPKKGSFYFKGDGLMKILKEVKPLMKLIKEEKGKIIFASILIFIAGLTEIFYGYLNGAAIEEVTKFNLNKALIILGIYFLFDVFVGVVLEVSANSILHKVESKLTRRLGFNTYVKALNLPAYAYEEKSSGEIINRITNDADSLSFIFGRILNVISSLVGSLVIIVYVFINSWIIGLELVTIVGLLYFIMKKFNPLLKEIHKERKEEQDKFTSLVNESVRGIREIKTLGIKNNLITDMRDLIKIIYDKSAREIDVSRKFDITVRSLKCVLEVLTFVLCAILVCDGQITIGFFIAMTYYVYRYMWLIENINDLSQNFQKLNVSLERVNEIIENRLFEDEKYGDKVIENPKGYIEFKDVTFAYPNEPNTLNNFNLTIEPNKKVAIVGKSGQGKSTLFNLMTRIFDIKNGSLLIDDIDIKDLTEEELRNRISIIRQEPFIFNRTIKENFEIVNRDITLDEIRKYCKLAYLDDYIMSLPKQYDTVLGEGGVNLSGGQKQRLSIARTLSKKSNIILFDEATSALDNNSQEYIKKAIDNLVKDHTVVIVAHRLSTIMDADIIHVVNEGNVVASGKHEELLENCEIYRNLYEIESLNS